MASTKSQARSGVDHYPDTTFLFYDASDIHSNDSLVAHITDKIVACNHATSITYESLPAERFESLLTDIDPVFERHSCRIAFNSHKSTLRLYLMPTEVHECHAAWIKNVFGEWLARGIITFAEYKHFNVMGSPRQRFSQGAYAGSVKEPDLFVRPDSLSMPSIVVESGWIESSTNLLNDMDLWLEGGNGEINAVIILDWTRREPNRVAGVVELYVLDRQGVPARAQREQVFPIPGQHAATQALHLSRRQLFGSTVFPGTNPRQILDLRLDLLREVADIEICQMGLIPA